MTKLYQEVYKLKQGALQGLSVAHRYGQQDAVTIWNAKLMAYSQVLAMLGDPEVTPTRWKRFICRVFHQKHSLKCPNCGEQF